MLAVNEEEFDAGVGEELFEVGVEAALLGPGPADGEVAHVEEQVDALMLEGADGCACCAVWTAADNSVCASWPRDCCRWCPRR